MTRRNLEGTVAATTDPDRWVRTLDGRRETTGVVHAVVPSGERERPAAKQAPHDLDRLHQPLEPDAERFEGQPGEIEFGPVPTGTKSGNDATLAQDIDRRERLRSDGGWAQRDAEHEGAELHPVGDAGQRRQAGEGVESRELAGAAVLLDPQHEVIGNPERPEAERLGALSPPRDRRPLELRFTRNREVELRQCEPELHRMGA